MQVRMRAKIPETIAAIETYAFDVILLFFNQTKENHKSTSARKRFSGLIENKLTKYFLDWLLLTS